MNADDRRGALDAVDRLVNVGGDADELLRGVLAALHARGVEYATIRFVEDGALVDGPSVGSGSAAVAVPIVFQGRPVGELQLSVPDQELAVRVATLISAVVLVGWDTGGEPWVP